MADMRRKAVVQRQPDSGQVSPAESTYGSFRRNGAGCMSFRDVAADSTMRALQA